MRGVAAGCIITLALIGSGAPRATAATGPCAGDCGDGNGVVEIVDLLALLAQWNGPGPCDLDSSGVADIIDLLALLASWGPCPAGPTGACGLPDCTCVPVTETECESLGGQSFVPDADCSDTDGDRIPDAFERDDCAPHRGCLAGTDPFDPDSDGDGIDDGDERYGTLAGLDLAALGADPNVPDIFLEVDWFDDGLDGPHSHRPTAAAAEAVVAAFAGAPVAGRCGALGVSLHLDRGQGGAFAGGNLIPGGDTVVVWDTEFNTYKTFNFASNRHGYFHYVICCHRFNSPGNDSSGIAELPGDDFIVSLQTSLSDSFVSKTMMHELGHNLDLFHGGFETRNYKPNYNSVMNYRYLFNGIDVDCNGVGDGVLDYSTGVLDPLDENALQETAGLCGAPGVDWNRNTVIDPGSMALNINCSSGCSRPCGSAAGCGPCGDIVCTLLADHDDWAALDLATGLADTDFAPPPVVTCLDVPAARLPRDSGGSP